MLKRPSSFRNSAFALTTAATMLAGSQFPSHAQTVLAANPPATEQSTTLRPVPAAECKYLAARFTEALQKHGKDFVSNETRMGVARFLVTAPQTRTFDCGGPREIPWVTGRDFDFVMALGNLVSGAYKPLDFRIDYGFKPAANPTVSNGQRQRSELTVAPGG